MFGIGIPELIILAIIFAIPAIIVGIILLSIKYGVNRSIKRREPMYCRKCGQQNDDNAFRCVECGNILQQPQQYGSGTTTLAPVPNYLVQAILVTLFCCLPFGIPAIVFAAQVNGKLAAGDYAGAVEKSQKAKTWCWVAFGVGLTIIVLWFLLAIIGASAN